MNTTNQTPYITGYHWEPTNKTLYLFRNGEQQHFEERPGVDNEALGLEIIQQINAEHAQPVAPAPVVPPAPTPAPTPTAAPTPAVETVQPVTTETPIAPPPPVAETPTDLPPALPLETTPPASVPALTENGAANAERASQRAIILKKLGMVSNDQGYYGYGFTYSFALLNNHTDEYFNSFVQGVKDAIADTPPAAEENVIQHPAIAAATLAETLTPPAEIFAEETPAEVAPPVAKEPAPVPAEEVAEIEVTPETSVEEPTPVEETPTEELNEAAVTAIVEKEDGKEMKFEGVFDVVVNGEKAISFNVNLSIDKDKAVALLKELLGIGAIEKEPAKKAATPRKSAASKTQTPAAPAEKTPDSLPLDEK